jgi:hypothetical protein
MLTIPRHRTHRLELRQQTLLRRPRPFYCRSQTSSALTLGPGVIQTSSSYFQNPNRREQVPRRETGFQRREADHLGHEEHSRRRNQGTAKTIPQQRPLRHENHTLIHSLEINHQEYQSSEALSRLFFPQPQQHTSEEDRCPARRPTEAVQCGWSDEVAGGSG